MRHIFILTAIMVVGVSSHEVERRQAKFVDDSGEKRVVCYYTNWSVYRKGLAKYTPKNINPYLCTHLIYAFGGLTDEFEVTTFDSYQDIEQGGYSQFNGLKQYNKDMKTLLALGGWNEGSARFSELVSLKEYRENFTLSAIRHLRRYNFDGLDLDWEYPASRDGSTPEDKPNYATLVMELREAFETEAAKSSKPRLLLTMAVPAGQNTIDKGYDVPTLNRYLDFFNLLTYDYHSIYEPSVNHHSALLPPPGISEYEVNYQLNVDWTIRYYVSKGASMNKLVLGIPTYGRSYTLLDADFFTMESSADGPGTKGNYTNEKGYLAFYEICEAVSLDGWEVRKPYPKRIGPFAFKGNQWVGYDDEKIAIRKSEYVLANGLGGIMFWTLDSDDFRGLCNGRQYPLIEAAKAALYKTSPTAANEARSLGDSADRNTISNLLSSQKSQQQKTDTTTAEAPSKRRRPGRRRPGSQTAVSIDPLNTPEPPTTPSSVKAFNCKREGFYPNPDDCKKYYWCLSSGTSGLGIVAHSFTCPSDLIFSKKIDGCDHPDRVKCKIGPSRGKAKAPPTTTPIPTTTEFEYLLEDLDYYYDYDFADTQLKPVQENVRIENFLEKNIIKPIRSGGANQFLDRIKPKTEKPQTPAPEILPKTPPKQPKPEPKQEVVRSRTPLQRPKPEAKQEVVRSRTPPQRPKPQPKQEVVRSRTPPQRPAVKERPQYSSIQRDRSRVREESIVEEQPVVESEVPSSPSQRPQYVTLNRKRPTSGDVVNDPLEQDYLDFIEPTPESVDSLTYITLQRSRDISTEPSVFHEGEATTAGLEYVTLRRKRPTKVPELDYEYEYLNEELDTATATPKETTTLSTTSTTTATTPKVNIRLPPRIRGRPRPSPRPRPNPPERPDPKEAAEKNDDKEDRISRFRGRINSQLEEKKYERVNRLTRLRGRLTPKPVETNEPEERVARPTRPRQKRPGLQPTEPEEEEAVVRPTRLRGRPTPKTTQPEKEVLERPTRPRGRPTSQLEEAKEQETADPPTSIREKPTSQITKPLEQDTTKEPAEVKKEPTAPLRKQKAQDVDHSIQTTERPSPETIAERLEEEIVVTEVPTESPQVVSKLPPIELSVAPIQDERVDEIIPKPIESKPAEMDANVQPLEKSVYTTDPPIEIEIKPKEIFEAKEEEKTVSSSHDGESLIEETLLLFSQNKPSQETEPSQPETRVRPFLERRKNPSSSRKLEPNIGLKEEPDTATIPVETPGPPPVRPQPRTRITPRPRPTPRTRLTPRPRERTFPPRPARPRMTLRPAVSEKLDLKDKKPLEVSRPLETDVTQPDEEFEVSKTETKGSATSSPFSFFDILPSIRPSAGETTLKTTPVPTTTATQPSSPAFRPRERPTPIDDSTSIKAPEREDFKTPPKFPFPLPPARTTTQKPTTTISSGAFFDFLDKNTREEIQSTPIKTTTEFEEKIPPRARVTQRPRPRPVQKPSTEPTKPPTPARTRPPARVRTTIPAPRGTSSPRPSRAREYVTQSSPLFPVDYDYVYDYDLSIGKLDGTLADLAQISNKAILHPDGTIECLDTGYFPHPRSCKKFISCSKTVRGFLRGWIYTCPEELVFDPVGGMCNWTEDVDCSKFHRA